MDDLEQMKAMVERRLEELGPALQVETPASSLRSARAAVRIALVELLLAAHPDPLPAAGILDRIREAVRARLAAHGRASRRAVFASPRFWSPLAAAAMVLLCVGIIHHSAYLRPSTGLHPSIEAFVQAGDHVLSDDVFQKSALIDLEAIEAGLASDKPGGDFEDGELRGGGDDFDEQRTDPETLQSLGCGSQPRKGASA
jgi:hypothetical protein